jgi:Transposase DDE domain
MREGQQAGVFDRLHQAGLDRLGQQGLLDWSRGQGLRQPSGTDNPRVRRYLRRRGITARIARIGIESSERLGRHRWVVERTNGWLLSYRRLALRHDRTETTITALARLAVILICTRRLPTN